MSRGEIDKEAFMRKYESHKGHLSHADAYHIAKAIEYELLFWEFEKMGDAAKVGQN